MCLQKRVEGIGGELHEVGGQPQALKFALAIRSKQTWPGSSKQEVNSRTPALLLSVVQTTKRSPRRSGSMELLR